MQIHCRSIKKSEKIGYGFPPMPDQFKKKLTDKSQDFSRI